MNNNISNEENYWPGFVAAIILIIIIALGVWFIFRDTPEPQCSSFNFQVGDQVFVDSQNANGVVLAQLPDREQANRCWYPLHS